VTSLVIKQKNLSGNKKNKHWGGKADFLFAFDFLRCEKEKKKIGNHHDK